MRLPLSWLNEYVKIDDVPVELLKNKLFSCGFEVEDVIYLNENVKNIVVCQINAIEQHPNADKLSVCQINAGSYGELQIVTNAKNIKVGDKVPVSLDGAVLADGTNIKKGKLRGVESDGMFCGGEEIGITEEYYDGAGFDGVLVFHDDFPVGADVCELLGVKDVVFDIGLTANRPDCQSIFGMAREVAACLGRELKEPDCSYTSITEEKCPVTVEIRDTELCPRYCAHYVKGVVIKPSPKSMQKKLALMGLRAINSVVDITNFVLLEMGQPMHAFDYAKLQSKKIVVRRAENGEIITTLDDKSFDLDSENLLVCDGENPVALAGIMGGKNSAISDDTAALVFECAKFKRDNVRKTSKSLGQRSDSSARFEKGVDAYTVELAMRRALHLVEEMGCGTVCGETIDVLNEDMTPPTVYGNYNNINKILGIEVPFDVQKGILEKLGFKLTDGMDGDFSCVVPPYRTDVDGIPDLAEEVIRSYGYDNVTGRLLSGATITYGGKTARQQKEDDMKSALVALGYNEILTYAFVSEKDYELLGLDKDAPENAHIKIMNPLGEEMSVMRTTLVPSMLSTVARNLARKNNNGRLFEYARVYIPKELPLKELPEEKNRLSLAVFGEGEDFFTLKGTIESLLAKLHVHSKVVFAKEKVCYLHPGRTAAIYVGETKVGYIGEVHPTVAAKFELGARVYVADIDFDCLIQSLNRKTYFAPISKYPSVERDLALVCDIDTESGFIEKLISERGGKNLVSIKLFDVYTGKGVDEGKKSMAYRLVFSSLEKTFGEGDVDGFIKKILRHLNENGITLR